MEYEDKVRLILEKLKKEYNNETQNILIERISESLELIEGAKWQMRKDAEEKEIPFGFDLDRFKQMRQHPGVDIIKTQHYSIRGSLKQLQSISTNKETEKPKGLTALMNKKVG